uniref:Uncharacterized protein n=1 Tax=Lygus hesperus TaxID=30085 RepID=A0A146LVB7_LYGHE
MQLKNNSLTVDISLRMDQTGCTLQLLTVTAKLDGMDVDAWGMTIFGNDYVEEVVRDMYNKNKENWENQIVNQVTSGFRESVEKYLISNPLVCHHTLSTMQQMDLLSEPFAHLHSNSNLLNFLIKRNKQGSRFCP